MRRFLPMALPTEKPASGWTAEISNAQFSSIASRTSRMVGKVIRGVKAKTGKNGELRSKSGRNRRSGRNRLNLIVEDDEGWTCVSQIGLPERILKEVKPNWYLAAVYKWGFVPVEKPIEINSLKEINDDTYAKAWKEKKWEKDYIT